MLVNSLEGANQSTRLDFGFCSCCQLCMFHTGEEEGAGAGERGGRGRVDHGDETRPQQGRPAHRGAGEEDEPEGAPEAQTEGASRACAPGGVHPDQPVCRVDIGRVQTH